MRVTLSFIQERTVVQRTEAYFSTFKLTQYLNTSQLGLISGPRKMVSKLARAQAKQKSWCCGL